MRAKSRLIPVYPRLDGLGEVGNNTKTMDRINKTRLTSLICAVGMITVASSATVITTNFEGLGNTDDNAIASYDKYPPSPTDWVPGSSGFGSDRAGANLIGTNAVWSFRYTNTGLTTALAAIGNLTAGTTYTITYDASADDGGATGGSIGLVTFNGGARNATESMNKNTTAVLGSWSTSTGTGITQSYTADGTEGTLGHDVAFRFTGASTSANIDNITITATAIPEPSTTALLGLGGLALILRRRK